MTSRREVIQKLFKGVAITGTGGLLWGVAAKEITASDLALRPPGAIAKEKFLKACIKCGQCVEACPYDTLKLGTPGKGLSVGTPYYEPRDIPCYMCTNFPCTEACPSGALDLKELISEDYSDEPNINNATMGLAIIHKESCIAFWGIQCDACYRSCPLIDEAITLHKEKNIVTGKHANLKPVVNSNVCTGCGVCERACVTKKAAIKVFPRDLAMGEVGDHYIKSWETNDEKRIENIKAEEGKDKDVESAMDYLNQDEELFD
jgi:ferredoxin-type protein NapG